MLDISRRPLLPFWSAALALGLSGCSSLPGLTNRFVTVVSPYKIDIVQGNVITREQLAQIKPGSTRDAVRDALGTPLLTSVFHGQRWDFVFTLRQQGSAPQSRKVTVFFKGDAVERIDADPLPSEAEFAATLKSDIKVDRAPLLQATEESLKNFPARAIPKQPASTAAQAPVDYPPLEPTSR